MCHIASSTCYSHNKTRYIILIKTSECGIKRVTWCVASVDANSCSCEFGFQSSPTYTTQYLGLLKEMLGVSTADGIRLQSIHPSLLCTAFNLIPHQNDEALLTAQEESITDSTNSESDSVEREVCVCVSVQCWLGSVEQESEKSPKTFSILNSCVISDSAVPH